jgi:hypothetical protein
MGTSIKINTRKLDEFKREFKKLNKSLRNSDFILHEIEDIGQDMRNYIIDRMTTTPRQDTGYKRGNKVHYPSKIENFPARDFGELVRSIRVEIRGHKIEIGSKTGAPYSKYLEDLDSEYTEKTRRRFLVPTVDHFSPIINTRLINTIRKILP